MEVADEDELANGWMFPDAAGLTLPVDDQK